MAEKFYDLTNPYFVSIMGRFVINTVFLFILLKIIYFRYSRKEKFLFSFFLMGIMAFGITSMLSKVMIEIGMAIGLFAVFGILRLKARNFSSKDMAYTFATFGISVINSLKLLNFPFLGILIINCIIVLSAYILEEYSLKIKTDTHSIIFENLELLKPERKEELLNEISTLTGKKILKIKILKINYKRKRAILNITYKSEKA